MIRLAGEKEKEEMEKELSRETGETRETGESGELVESGETG